MTEELHLEGDNKVPSVEPGKKLVSDLRRRSEPLKSEKEPPSSPKEDLPKDEVELSDEAKRLSALSGIKPVPPIEQEDLNCLPNDERDETI